MQSQAYRDASRRLLDQAFHELAQGDTQQASEKGWGATAQMLKCIAEQRGWEHRGHRLIRQTASRLADETGNAELRRLYRVADSLHINFYENVDTSADVASGLEDVQRLLGMLESLAEAESPMVRYLVNPASNIVHRENGCTDAQRHGHGWTFIGYFSSIRDAAEEAIVYKVCGNCVKLRAES